MNSHATMAVTWRLWCAIALGINVMVGGCATDGSAPTRLAEARASESMVNYAMGGWRALLKRELAESATIERLESVLTGWYREKGMIIGDGMSTREIYYVIDDYVTILVFAELSGEIVYGPLVIRTAPLLKDPSGNPTGLPGNLGWGPGF